MDLTTGWNTHGVEVTAVNAPGRCAICKRQSDAGMFALREQLELPVPHQSWVLCGTCAIAVVREVERAALHTSLRIRIAAGIVAAEQSIPPLHRVTSLDRAGQTREPRFSNLVMAVIVFLCMLPLLIFLLVTVLGITASVAPW